MLKILFAQVLFNSVLLWLLGFFYHIIWRRSWPLCL